ncbi:MAG: HlyD family efflux transporter periplasmic adaptor subunit [Acutalibacteraceae bacterium]|nr:HlyD family efflux transporter periplasmic adaptor subunit [Acutalibacteraceae bacterium]
MNKKQKEQLKRWIIIIFSVLILFYIVHQVRMVTYKSVRTESVPSVTANDSVKTKVFVVRSEQYVRNRSSGTVISLVNDGNRVSNGGGVAAIFKTPEDAGNYARTSQIGDELKRYNRLNSQNGSYAVNVNSMNAQISSEVIDLAEAVDAGNLDTAQEDIYGIRDTIITRQIATGTTLDLNPRLAALNQEYSSLMQKSAKHSSINAKSSGYYSSGADGYETTVNYNKVKDLTVKDIKKIMKEDPKPVPEDVIGKITNDFDWYLLCVVPVSQGSGLTVGDSVTVSLPHSAVSSVEAKVAAVNRDGKSNQLAVILSSNRMNSSISHLRKEEAELIMNSYTGLRVNVKAITANSKGVKGVYIKQGNIARFRRLDVVYSTEKYVISRPHETGNYVALYDNVIIGGKGLYDGKIVR